MRAACARSPHARAHAAGAHDAVSLWSVCVPCVPRARRGEPAADTLRFAPRAACHHARHGPRRSPCASLQSVALRVISQLSARSRSRRHCHFPSAAPSSRQVCACQQVAVALYCGRLDRDWRHSAGRRAPCEVPDCHSRGYPHPSHGWKAEDHELRRRSQGPAPHRPESTCRAAPSAIALSATSSWSASATSRDGSPTSARVTPRAAPSYP